MVIVSQRGSNCGGGVAVDQIWMLAFQHAPSREGVVAPGRASPNAGSHHKWVLRVEGSLSLK